MSEFCPNAGLESSPQVPPDPWVGISRFHTVPQNPWRLLSDVETIVFSVACFDQLSVCRTSNQLSVTPLSLQLLHGRGDRALW
jgi:hypothetical protein